MISTINSWNVLIQNNPSVEIYEAAFLRIYIEYEVFLSDTFIRFSLGNGVGSYTPKRKINFLDENQLRALIRGDGAGVFIDFSKAIDRCSKHIFEKDPFNLLKTSANFSDDLTKMKCIRNYLAHRSNEAKDKYIRSVLNAHNINTFIEPGVFLQKKMKKNAKTNYTNYCEIFCNINQLLNNDIILSSI